MKIRFVMMAIMMASLSLPATAQEADKNMFNHLAVGLSVGMPGISIDVAAPVGNYVQLRAGVSFFPNIKAKTDLSMYIPDRAYDYGYEIPDEVNVEGKVGFVNGMLLADVFPFKKSNFHVTAGFYVGTPQVVKAYNTQDGLLMDVVNYNRNEGREDPIGVKLGDYLLTPDDEGNVNAQLKTWAFKPYVGIGFGRAVPKTKRVGFMFELGCQFWGSPSVWCNGEKLEKDKVGDSSSGAIIKTISKITVYPVLNFRLCGRIL